MIRQAKFIRSTYELLFPKFKVIRQNDLGNGDPSSFIDTHIAVGFSRYMDRQVLPTVEKPIGCEKKRMHFEIPFIRRTDQTMKHQFNHLSSYRRSDLDILAFTRPTTVIPTFFHSKDSVAKHIRSNLMYSMQYNGCDQLYIGKIIRRAMIGLYEHVARTSAFDSSY